MKFLRSSYGRSVPDPSFSTILRMEENVHLFTDAKPANFGDGVVGCSSFNNIPVDVERDTVFDEIPDICTECGPLMLLIQCCDVSVVLVVSGLHWIVSTTSVCFPVTGVSPGDSCPIHQVVHHAAYSITVI